MTHNGQLGERILVPISTDIIIWSFEACGITNDPNLIHCTKVGGVAEAA